MVDLLERRITLRHRRRVAFQSGFVAQARNMSLRASRMRDGHTTRLAPCLRACATETRLMRILETASGLLVALLICSAF